MRKAVIVSGYFNPLHKGHIDLFEKSREVADFLIIVVNSDLQRELKGSKEFMDENERLKIIQSLKDVGYSCISIDKDKTQIETLKMLNHKFGDIMELHFANGGDQNNNTIPAEASGGRAICSMKYCAWPPSTMALPKATERMSRA